MKCSIGAQHTLKGVNMNSFTLTAVGNLAKDPELAVKGDTSYARFCLVGNDYAGKDEQGNAREAVTSVWFVAFEGLGEAIAKNARKGDQLIVQAQIRSNNWTDQEGEKQIRPFIRRAELPLWRSGQSKARGIGRAARGERNRRARDGDLKYRGSSRTRPPDPRPADSRTWRWLPRSLR